MYQIKYTSAYRKSIKRIKRSGLLNEQELNKVIDGIASGKSLDKKNKDHALQGDMLGYRECHIKSDLLLVYYKKETNLILVLVNIGSHSHLFN